MSISVIRKLIVPKRMLVGSAFVVLSVSAYSQPAPRGTPGAGPIGYTAHGGIFDTAGNEIAPSLAFIETAQAWYRDRLLAHISEQSRTRFEAMERRISTQRKFGANLTPSAACYRRNFPMQRTPVLPSARRRRASRSSSCMRPFNSASIPTLYSSSSVSPPTPRKCYW